jgi:putative tricarboxylic transport membrane protein
MQRAEKVGGLLCLGLALYVMWQAWGMEYYTELGPGPGFFPIWLGLLLGVLSLMWLFAAFWRSAKDAAARFLPAWDGCRRIIIIVAAFITVAALLEVIGFQLTMFAFVAFVYLFLGGRSWYMTLILAVGLSFGVYRTFTGWLDVVLPQASIGLLRNLGF